MKDAVSEIHKTEGFPYGKVANARNQDADWLTKIVQANAKMQAAIPATPSTKGLRKAIYDSWKNWEWIDSLFKIPLIWGFGVLGFWGFGNEIMYFF